MFAVAPPKRLLAFAAGDVGAREVVFGERG